MKSGISLLILFLIILPKDSFFQFLKEPRYYHFDQGKFDSYDKYEVAKQIDSITTITKIDSLWNLFHELNKDENKYVGLNMNFGWQNSYLDELNSTLEQLGISPVKEGMFTLGIGIFFRNKNIIHSYDLGFSSTKNDGQSDLWAQVNEADLKLILGYNLLKSTRRFFYPFLGLKLGGTDLSMRRNYFSSDFLDTIDTLNSSFNSLSIHKNNIGYVLGFQFDGFFKAPTDGIGLGLKFAYSQPFYESKWRSGSEKFYLDEEIITGVFSISLVLKFGGNPEHKL